MPDFSFTEGLKKQFKDEESAGVRASFSFASQYSTADYAAARNVAKQAGVRTSAVLDPEVRKILEPMTSKLSMTPEEFLGTAPVAAKWIQKDPDNAALSFSSLPQVSDLESRHQKLIEEHRKEIEANNRARGVSYGGTTFKNVVGSVVGMVATPWDVLSAGVNAALPKEPAESVLFAMRFNPALTASWLASGKDQWYYDRGQRTEDLLLKDPKTGEEFFNWSAYDPRRVEGLKNYGNIVSREIVPFGVQAYAAFQSGGASVLFNGADKLGKVARVVQLSTKLPAVMEIGRTIQGQYNEGVRQLRAQGMDESSAQQKVAGGALLAGAFSFALGAPMEAKFFEHLEELANHVPGGSIAQRAWARAKAFVSSGLKEGLQEVLNGIGEDTAAFLTYNDDMTAKEFAANLFQNAIGGVLLGGPSGAMIQGTHAARKGQQYDAQRKFLEQLADPEKRGELGKLAPDKFGELVSEITKGGPIEDLAIPAKAWDTYWQSVGEDPDAKAAEMGVGLEDLRVARESEGDLVLSTGTVAEKIAGTDHFLDLLPSMKPGLSSDSFGEIQAQAQAVEANEKLMSEMASVEDSDERNQIRNIIAAELKAASKVYNESQASTIADGYARVIMVQAKRSGQTPLQLFEKERVKILDGYGKIQEQEVARAAAQPEGGTGPSAVQGEGVGRDAGAVHGGDGSVPSGVPQGELADAPAGLEFAAGVRPPGRLWHGTSGNFSQLVAEGLTPNQAGGMPGLNLSAGPDVMGSYAEGNQDGHWKVQLDEGFRPIDLSPEKLYTPEQVQALGFTDAAKPYSGHDLWMYAMSRLGSEGAKAHFMGLGFNGSYYAHGGEDAYSVWLDSLIKRQGKTTMAQAQAEYALQGSRRDSVTGELKGAAQSLFQPLSSRMPTSKKFVNDPNQVLLSGVQAMAEDPKVLKKNLDAVAQYPGVKFPPKASDAKRTELFVTHVKDNLTWLYNQLPQEVRKDAARWYEGANKKAQEMATKSSKTLSQMAGVIAVLSPQKDWFQNVSLAERVIDIMQAQQATTWSDEMTKTAARIFAKDEYSEQVQRVTGKTLGELTSPADKAMWLRTFDETYNDRSFQVYHPSGEAVGPSMTAKGAMSKVAWGSLNEIAKAIRVFEDASPRQISDALGTAHKVRNFYNNIFDPTSPDFVTIDTHAVGAGLLLPLSASSLEAGQNFGTTGSASSAITGSVGTYGLFQEGYLRAAQELGVLPRDLQSVTWEAVRGLFPAEKKNEQLYKDVSALWKKYTTKKATIDETRAAIKEKMGGIKAPEWHPEQVFFQTAKIEQELNAPTISVESMPGSAVRKQVLPGIENATPEQLNAYHEAKMQIVEDALREGGIELIDSATGYGYWDGESNLVTGFHLASIEDAQRAAQLVAQVVGDQDAIGWNAQVNEPDVEKHNAVLLEFSRPLTEQEATKLGDELAKTGLPAFHDASNPAAVKVINYDMGEGSALDFHAKIEALANGLLTEGLTVDPQSYAAISNLEKAPNETGPGQSPSLAPHVDRGRSRIADLNSRFIRQFAERGQPSEDRGQPRVPVLQRGSAGGANPVSVIGTHYGAVEGLTKLDPSKHGTGSAGREMRRLSAIDPGSEQAVLKQRAYFYVQDGEGLPPKERVVRGSSPYLAQFNNIYDLDADPEGLREKIGGDLNSLEMSVLKAGYDGYLGSAPGVPGRALVVLGPGPIQVVPADPSGRPMPNPLEGPDGGIALYQPGDGQDPSEFARGFLRFGQRGQDGSRTFNLGLLQQENHSTVFHELGHFYLELLGDLAADPNANQSVRDDYATILKWFGVSDRSQITRDMHEQFADAHLVYLLEGKAPAIELIGPFRKFTRWLTKVGKQLLQADVPMNDEVRKVFDRLYAVDEEIEAAKGVLGPELFATAEQAGLSQAEFDLLRKHRAKAIEEAKERLISKVMKELERSRKQEWKDELATAKARITEELGARPEYVAQKAMNDKVAPDGTSLEGMTDDEAAVVLGFDDGAQLRETLKNTRPLEKVVNELAKAYMVQEHGDLLETGQIKDEALKLLAGARQEEALKAELEVLRRLARKEQAFIAEGRRQQKATDRAAQAETDKARTDAERAARAQDTEGRKQAKDILRANTFKATAATYIRNLPLHRVKPMQYLGLQKKFDMQAYKAALRNDYQAAAEAKERALLNHYLYLEAERAVEEGEKARAWLKRNDSSTVRGKIGKAGGDFLAHFDAIRDRFGIERAPAKLLEAVHTLAEWAQMMEDSHEDTVVAQWLLDQGAVVNYRELSANQLNDVINALKNIKHLAYRETTMLINGQRIERAQALSEIISSAKANNSSKPLARASSPDRERAAFKAKGFLAGFDASLVKIETLINYIDGNDVNGPAHRYIWDRIVSAQAKMLDLQGEVNRKLIGVLEQMPPELRASMDEHVVVPGWTGANLTRKEIVTMALYSGQDSRRLKLVKGWERFGMSDATLTKALSMLTAEEVSLVNSVWEAFDTIRPMVLDLEERLSGVRPEWENATPRDVYDPNGTFVGHLKGGYFPLVADPTYAGELGKKQEGGPVGQLFGNGYARASTSKGHTKELTGATYPLLLDFQNTLSSQLANQIKDLAFREAVLDINRIFKSKEFQLAIKETLGEPYEAQLMPWLVNVVNDFNAGSTNGLAWWNRAATTVKSHTVAAMLGFKLSTVFMQVTDLARATSPGDFRVGTRALAKAYMQFLAHPDQTIEMVRELSGEMRHRAEALDRDLRSEFNRLRGKQTLKARWNRIGFKMLGWVDTIFSTPVWLGAYQDALRSGADEDTAIRTADRTVRTRLMTSHPKDIVAVQRNNELMKLLTMFMGDSFTNYNMLRQSGHNLDSLKRISSFTAQTVMLGLLFALGEMIRGQGPEDDEDDLLWLLRKMAMYPTQIVPVVKDGASALENTFTGKPFNKYQLSPVVAWAQKSLDVVPATVKFVEGDIEWDDYLIKAGEGLGYALGVGGTNQLTASAKYFKRYTEGEEQPSNPLEFGFDLARGKRKEK